MSKVFKYLKSLKVPSKILIGVWMFCMFVVTFDELINKQGFSVQSAEKDPEQIDEESDNLFAEFDIN